MAAKTLRQWAGLTPPAGLDTDKTAMLLIDIQMDYFTPGKLEIPDGEAVLEKVAKLREWARTKGIRIIHIQQLSKAGGPLFASDGEGVNFHPKVAPKEGEKVITKALPSSFINTELGEYLKSNSIDTLIIIGLMTHMCVETTARDAAQLGYKAIVVSDCTASRDLPNYDSSGVMPAREVHAAALTAIADRFADIMPSEKVMTLV